MKLYATTSLTALVFAVWASGETSASAQAAPAHAPAGQLEEVVVTARRSAESLQKTPISITALSAQSLERARVVAISDIAPMVPNLVIKPQVAMLGGLIASIRGIGMGENQMSIDPPIGIYLDGVYVGRNNSANFELVDLERVEVLRGPQGTLFGRNTTGGAINMTSRAPADEFGVTQKIGVGNYSQIYSKTTLETGELGASGISATLSYLHRQQDGFVDNSAANGSHDPGSQASDAVWLKAAGVWGDLKASYAFDYAHLQGQPIALVLEYATPDVQRYFGASSAALGGTNFTFAPGRKDDAFLAVSPQQKVTTYGHSLTLEYDVSNALTLKSITGWRHYEASLPSVYGAPGLRGRVLVGTTPTVAGLNVLRSIRVGKQHQLSQELQALGAIGDFNYVVGAYYYREKGLDDSTTFSAFVLPGGALAALPQSPTTFTFSNRSRAVYAHLGYRPSQLDGKLEVTVGARYTVDDKGIIQYAPQARLGDARFEKASYNVTASYQWAPDFMTYARFGTGFRSGGFNTRAALTGNVPFVYQPERAKVYEAGFKSQFFDGRARLNGAAFYTTYKDLQTSQFTFSSTGTAAGQNLNADATYRGFELETAFLVTRDVNLNAGVGYVRPKFQRIFFPAPGTGILTNYASTSKFSQVPKWSANIGVDYKIFSGPSGDLSLNATYTWQDKISFNTTNLSSISPWRDFIAQSSYGLANARLTWSQIPVAGKRLEASLWARNIFDKKYRISGIDFGSLGYAGTVYGAPRTFGLDLTLKF